MKYHLNWVSEYAHNIRHNCATKLNLKVFLEAKVTIASRNTLKYSFYAKKKPKLTLSHCDTAHLYILWIDIWLERRSADKKNVKNAVIFL